jgi:hypothetical protein
MKRLMKSALGVVLCIGGMSLLQSCQEKLPTTTQTEISTYSAAASSSNALATLVTNCDHPDWMTQNQAGASGLIEFVNGPDPAILGNGSLKFNCPDSKYLRYVTNKYLGLELKFINKMSFSTYVEESSVDNDNFYVSILVDLGDGVPTPFVFNPKYQTDPWVNHGHDQGAVAKNVWQTWDMFKGVWWMGPDKDPESGGDLNTLDRWASIYPGAKIYVDTPATKGSIRFTTGGGPGVFGTNFIGYMDNFVIKTKNVFTAYDFEYCQP